MNNLNYDEITALLFEEEELKTMKAVALRRAAAEYAVWKKEMTEIMNMFDEDENNDIIEEVVGEEDVMEHTVLLDTEEFSRKPNSYEVGGIQKRLPNSATTVTIEELAKALVSGRTFKPNYMTGRSQDSFVSSSLIAIDIDNKGTELEEHGYITIDNFKDKIAVSDLRPAIVYTTFSHTESVHKYRAIFQLNRIVTNLNELKAIGAAIKAEYPFSDAKVSVVHPIYGGKELVYLDPYAVINPMVDYEKEVKTTASRSEKIIKIELDKKILTEELLVANLAALRPQFEGQVIDITDSFEWINDNIPMTAALGYDLNTRFRCILPDHVDSKPSARISETIDGRQNYICSCGNTYLSLLDVVSKALNKNKLVVQYIIADALGITIGSKYQKDMRLLIADLMANTDRIIKPDSVLYKFMTRSNLHGLYNLIQQFASAHITMTPLGASDRITFFMAQSQIQNQMRKFNMRGSSMIGYKLNTLKEIGLIRALKDEEIQTVSLEETKKIQFAMATTAQNKYINRIEYYELCLITPQQVKRAEEIIIALKDAGVKRRHHNSVRRSVALGTDFAAGVNVQTNVENKLEDPKMKKKLDKMVSAAAGLIEKQKYFTEDQLRQAYDPKRKYSKSVVQKTIDDAIPLIIQTLGIEKNRVKKPTRTLYSIPNKIKTNTTIYC